MKYKTKGGVSHRGKMKVYFACHPSDMQFMEILCLKIWKHRDVSVWYKEESDESVAPDELRLMQLMIMPVTSKLLESGDCPVFSEVAFFIENNIPVLPIMMERGLETLYNEVFHNIQFLNESSLDPTELSLEDKLHYTLDVLLPTEEIIERVRKDFSAYIFLSYRKKDRQKAQELMKMIHRVPEYQDVAIWYDEFIVGSEDFNDSISRALKRCDLFTLMITPNLIVEDNYVKEIEFPMALEEQKEILPIEMVSTNREELCNQFKGMPNVINGDDKEFANFLRDKYKKLALVRKEGYPEHDYLMGLAYLNGIDVETNFSMAEKLIRAAADAGVVEAMGELVNMLCTGKGITKDYEEAIRVQKQKVEAVSKMEDSLLLVDELDRLGQMYITTRKIKEAAETYEELRYRVLLGYGEQPCLENRILAIKNANSWIKTGEIWELECDYTRALSAYKQAELFSAELFQENAEGIQADYIVQMSNIKSGNILLKIGRLESALEQYQKAEIVSNHLLEITDNDENRRRACKSKVLLASAYMLLEDYEAAAKYLESGMEMAKRLADDIDDSEDIYLYTLYCDGWGDYYKAGEDWDSAAAYYNQSCMLRQKQRQEDDSIESKLNLLQSYVKICELLHVQGSYSEAEEYCAKGEELYLLLKEKTTEPELQYAIIRFRLCYGDIRNAQENRAEALQNYREGLTELERFLHQNKDIRLINTAIEYYIKHARLAHRNGDLEIACEQYWKGVFLAKARGSNLLKPYETEARNLEAEFIKRQGKAYFDSCLKDVPRYAKDAEGAKSAYDVKFLCETEAKSPMALAYAAKLTRLVTVLETGSIWEKRTISIQKAHVNCCTRLAEVEEVFGFVATAKKDYEKAIYFSELNGLPQMRNTLITSCNKMVQFAKRNELPVDIQKYIDKMQATAEKIAEENPSEDSLLALANWYSQQAANNPNNAKAPEYYQKALDIVVNLWNRARGSKRSPLMEEWYVLLDEFETENGTIELLLGQDNAVANSMLLQWYQDLEQERKDCLQEDLQRYLTQDRAGKELCSICLRYSDLLYQMGETEDEKKVMELKEFVSGELLKEQEYFRYWMKLVQLGHLLGAKGKE